MKTKTEEVITTYALCLIGPPEFVGGPPVTRKLAPEVLREAEENITDLLPAFYRVEIREWFDETEETLT